MKKRLFPLALALIMALSMLPVTVFAANPKPVTVGNVTFSDVVVTDTYESFADYLERQIAEGAKNIEITDKDRFLYRLGMSSVKPEEGEDYQFSSFSSYIIPDNATISFNSTKEQEVVVYFLTLTELPESASRSDSYYEIAWAGDLTYTLKNWSLTRDKILDPETWQGYGVPDFDLIAIRVSGEEDIYVMFYSDSPLATTDSAPSFTDVPAGEWFADPVAWAVEKGITNGTTATTFSPSQNCTHAQILTFLYRAARDEGAATADDMDKAISWAREKGMIDSSFDGSKPCTRADAVNYIWQAFNKPSAKAGSFTDVPANAAYAKAVNWAVEKEVTNGTSTNSEGTTFSPDKVCNRGEIVTFLFRAYTK